MRWILETRDIQHQHLIARSMPCRKWREMARTRLAQRGAVIVGHYEWPVVCPNRGKHGLPKSWQTTRSGILDAGMCPIALRQARHFSQGQALGSSFFK